MTAPRLPAALARADRAAWPVGIVAAILGLLAVLLLGLALTAGRLARGWDEGLADTATLQIVAPEDAVEAQARAALDILRATEGVRSVRVMQVDEQRALLAPWFGSDLALDALPLPLLIEVTLDPASLDRAALDARLAAAAPAAAFDDHAAWRDPLIDQARGLRLAALAGLGLVTAALTAVLALATAASASIDAPLVRALRLVGARDRLIREALAASLTRASITGLAAGALAGLAMLALLPASGETGVVLAGIAPRGLDWALLALVPVLGAALAWVVIRAGLHRHLRAWS